MRILCGVVARPVRHACRAINITFRGGVHVTTEVLERIVKEYARQLKGRGLGYLEAIDQIADELYDVSKGKRPPISKVQNVEAAGFDPSKIPLKEVLGIVDKLLDALLSHWREKREQVKNLRDQVTPWVGEVYMAK